MFEFDNLAMNFPQLRYVACEDHREYTERTSGLRDKWAFSHAHCSQLRFYIEAPPDYEPCLDPLEALASTLSCDE